MDLITKIDPLKLGVRHDGEALYLIGKCRIGDIIEAAVEIKGQQMPLDQLLKFNDPDEFDWDDGALKLAEKLLE